MNSIDHISAFIFSEYTLYPFISFPANISAISHLILTQLNFGLRIWSPLQNTNPTIYSTLHFIADYQVCLIVLYLISAKIPLSINWSFNGFPVIIYRKKHYRPVYKLRESNRLFFSDQISHIFHHSFQKYLKCPRTFNFFGLEFINYQRNLFSAGFFLFNG